MALIVVVVVVVAVMVIVEIMAVIMVATTACFQKIGSIQVRVKVRVT